MNRLAFLRTMIRSLMLTLISITAGFLLFKNSRKTEICPELRSISNCQKCRLLDGCGRPEALSSRDKLSPKL